MGKEKTEQASEVEKTAEDLPKDHSGFEHYCNHFTDEDDTFLCMILEEDKTE